MVSTRRLVLLSILLITNLPVLRVSAQTLPAAFEMDIPGLASFDTEIPTPRDITGHTIGERHTVPHQLVDYFKAVAAASDRVVLGNHGYTYENRPLIHAIVTSPSNHARIEDIRTRNLRLSDAPGEVTSEMMAGMPAVVYQGYSIHGNEASGSEAALLYLYFLAAGQGEMVDQILENTVIILDPSFNPDGRDRFTDWVNRNRGGVHATDPQDREHNEPWPGGRTNHYWFDLNRDWLPAQHPESQGRLELFHHWRPQILTDHHEMGGASTFFFMPGIPSRNNPYTPAPNFELTASIAAYHARWLDQIGSMYYSRESFDDYYYGKGSTYPDANGAIGILFEQASSRALETETPNGMLPYAVTVQNQFATSLSTIDAVVNLRTQLLAHQQTYYATAPQVARDNPVKAYVVDLSRDRTRAQLLAQVLRRHRIALYDLARDVELMDQQFTAGEAFVVPVDQPQARLVKAVFERFTTFTDSLFYDVSAWTLPLAFDVNHGAITGNPAPFLGAAYMDVELDGGAVVGGASEIGYLMQWNRYFAPRALYRLLEAGFYPRLLHHPVTAVLPGGQRAFQPGTIFIPARHRDPASRHLDADLYGILQAAAAEDFVQIYALSSGYTPAGPDMGTRSATILSLPEIALITGSGASSYNAGEVWHLLSERFRIPVSLLEADGVQYADLDRYTTIVMAGGSYRDVDAEILNQWVRNGGVLIPIASAVDWAVQNDLLDLEVKENDIDSLFVDLPFDQLDEARGAQVIGGAIFTTDVDPTHPVAYAGLDTVPVFRRGTRFYEPATSPGQNVAVYAASPLLSGYIAEEQLERMSGSAAIVAVRRGQGRLIAFMDNPNFRAFWYGGNRLFLNAVFFGSAF